MLSIITVIIVINFRYKKEPGMVFDTAQAWRPPPEVQKELARECTTRIDVVRAEIPHLQDKIKSMTTYTQKQVDDARDALKKVETQEKEVETLR